LLLDLGAEHFPWGSIVHRSTALQHHLHFCLSLVIVDVTCGFEIHVGSLPEPLPHFAVIDFLYPKSPHQVLFERVQFLHTVHGGQSLTSAFVP